MNFVGDKMYEDKYSDPDHSYNLIEMSNEELLAHGTAQPNITILENELLHRLETFISIYGDYLDPKARERD